MEDVALVVLTGFYLVMAAVNGRVVRRILKRSLPGGIGAENCTPIRLRTVGDWNRVQRWIVPFRLIAAAVYAGAAAAVVWGCVAGVSGHLPSLIATVPVAADLGLYGASYAWVHSRLSAR